MPFALKNFYDVFFWGDCANTEDNAILMVDAYTPPSAEVASKRFRVADAGCAIPVYALKELVNAL